MKKLKLNLDGKMLSKEQMKQIVGGYAGDACDQWGPNYSEAGCCSLKGGNPCRCPTPTGDTLFFCTTMPCSWLCDYFDGK